MWRNSMRAMACALALASGLAGCKTGSMPPVSPVGEVMPHRGEFIVVDHIEIVVDSSASMACEGKFEHAAALVQSFVGGMPLGDYQAGLTVFGQDDASDWVRVPLAPFDRGALSAAVNPLPAIRGRTPLQRAMGSLEPGLAGREGRGVVLVVSDGLAPSGPVLEACRRLVDSHAGPVCIYTVQIGTDPNGHVLLTRMAEVPGCGRRVGSGFIGNPDGMHAFIREIFFGGVALPAEARVWPELPPVYFDTDKSNIKPQYENVIRQAVEVLAATPSLRLLLDGHADARNTEAYNLALGLRRANAVHDALVRRGIDPSRLRVYSWGKSKPAASNDTAAGLAQNRRVDLIILPE